MTAMRIAVAGASGRMGRTLLAVLGETADTRLAGALVRTGNSAIGRDAGELVGLAVTGVALTDNANAALADADAVLDFSTPAASVTLAESAAAKGMVHVIGTTGLSPADMTRIKAAARRAVIVQSGNMSLGVNLLAALVREAAKALPNYDIEILEMHHRMKVDAPSGTAILLGEAAAEGRGVNLNEQKVRARDGNTGRRPDGAIGFASLRGGTVVGEHTVVLAGAGERIELIHRAEDRMIFAQGAIAAARWAMGKSPGLYSMADVLGLA
ncbi:MAG: 4-hydroxy-tetrahydrodipicolinate reductase [Alphaproteobacteria bacterium]